MLMALAKYPAMLRALGVRAAPRRATTRHRAGRRARLLREVESARAQAHLTNNGMTGHLLQPRRHGGAR